MSKSYDKFLNITYSGRQLLEKHNLRESGFWQIYGEDPNCDWGGYHYNPDLGIVEGVLEDVIRYAVELPRFWQWGSGGKIEKVDVNYPKITPAVSGRIAELKEELNDLSVRKKEIEQSLKNLGAK